MILSKAIHHKLQRIKHSIFIIFVSSILLSACSKGSTEEPTPDPDVPTNDSIFNRLIVVKNFGELIPVGAEPTTPQSPIYYSLETNSAITADYQRTARWDISFADIYRSNINCNNTRADGGAGGPGKGGILLLEQAFEDVVDIPADNLFKTGDKPYGLDINGALGEDLGWVLYDFSGSLVRDGAYDNAHIAYPLDKPLTIKLENGQPKTVPARTIVVRTAKGNYAKLKVTSFYKDKLDRDSWRRNDPKPFFSFEYVLAKAGSSKFEIK
ncbi:HmuY family protein [Sphingobacterium deserti]|uniref:HmuY protein n=1 Tax=Sphingobacterium deserti TaxID=1229276 RepID=A0A0B8SYT6_9SPHI|nr:HmuY family protein [Sphingobacterium deserti]KGE12346.1 hypothetical protein DI53_3835 [Sphingobacterium deserti]